MAPIVRFFRLDSERSEWGNDIEGKAARGAASECGQRASFNGATGMSDSPVPQGSGRAGGRKWSEWDERHGRLTPRGVAVERSGSGRDTMERSG